MVEQTTLANGLHGLILSGLVAAVYKLITNATSDPSVWKYKGGTKEEKEKRLAARASLTSIMGSLVLSTCGVLLRATGKLDDQTYLALFGIVFVNVVGFILDSAFASDDGVEAMKEKGLPSAMQFGISKVASINFARYVLCIALDLFLSSILVSKFMDVFDSSKPGSLLHSFANAKVRGASLGKIMVPTYLSIVVGMLTFYSYTNQTRFNWAIRDSEKETPNLIDSNTMLMVTSVALTLFLSSSINGDKGMYTPGIKSLVCAAVFGLMIGLYMTGTLDAKPKETDPDDPNGMYLFFLITALSIVPQYLTSSAPTTQKKLMLGAMAAATMGGTAWISTQGAGSKVDTKEYMAKVGGAFVVGMAATLYLSKKVAV